MIVKPPARALCSCHHITASTHPRIQVCPQLFRSTSRNFSGTSARTQHDIPEWPKQSHPTPYEIFDIPKSAPYKKHRFYQLVKLYHPDTGTSSISVSHDIRLERYRLIVAANVLLSDPSKRQLYDVHGLGWRDADPSAPASMHERDKTWRHKPNSPARNANWEDWEAWREAQKEGGKAEPVFMSNGMFAAAVISAAFIGCVLHLNRGRELGQEYVQYSVQRNADIGNTIRQSAIASAGRSKDDRIEGFLREKENTAYNYVPRKYEPKVEETES